MSGQCVQKELSEKDRRIAATLPLFTDLPEETVEKLLGCARLLTYPAGEVVVGQGEAPKELYVVMMGSLKLLRTQANGDETMLRLIEREGLCMETVLFAGVPSPVSVETVEKTTLLALPAEEVRRTVVACPSFSQAMLHVLAKNAHALLYQVEHLRQFSTEQKVGWYLMREFIRYNPRPKTITLPREKVLIAEELGIQPESLSRAFNKLRAKGIKIEGDRVTLPGTFALCGYCSADIAVNCPRVKTGECPREDLLEG